VRFCRGGVAPPFFIILFAFLEGEETSPLQLVCYILWVILIIVPLQWIIPDIFSDRVQFIIIPDNTFKIISLPDRHASCIADFIDLSGNGGFK
jgi:hypothetical protein